MELIVMSLGGLLTVLVLELSEFVRQQHVGELVP
jgi:hypothetical protein